MKNDYLLLTTAIVHGAKTGNEILGFSCCFLSLGGQEIVPQNVTHHRQTVVCKFKNAVN